MARIFRTDIYEFDTLPTFNDYVIGTDGDDFERTKNFRIADLAALIDGSATTFLALVDTPISYAGQAGNSVVVNGTEDGLEFGAGGGGSFTFLELTDTPNDYSGQAGLLPRVNDTEDGLEFGAYVTIDTEQDITASKTFSGGGSNAIDEGIFVRNGIVIGGNITNGYLEFAPAGSNFDRTFNPSVFQGTNKQYRIGIHNGDWIFMGTDDETSSQVPYTRLVQNYTAARTHTWQDKDGVIAHLDDIVSGGGVTQTESTFDPNLTDDGGGATYNVGANSCRYIRTGNLVHIYFNLSMITTVGVPSGRLSFTLPFNSLTAFQPFTMGQLFYGGGGSPTPNNQVIPHINAAGDNQGDFKEFPSTSSLNARTFNNGFIRFGGTYIIDPT